MLNDLISYVVALAAQLISEKAKARPGYSFGWQRATLLGSFFNGVFLLALGVSILLQSVERFITLQPVKEPMLVLIIGCVGLALNLLSGLVVGHNHDHDHGHSHSHSHDHAHHNHEHELDQLVSPANIDMGIANDQSPARHSEHRHHKFNSKKPGRDLGMLGVLNHIISDAINNIGVIVAAVIIWQTTSPQRFYADPAASVFIAIMIFCVAISQTTKSGNILLQSAPQGVVMDDVKHDLEKIPGIDSVHELHIWRLDQQKAIASAHIVVSDEESIATFKQKAQIINECLHAYGIHSATLQPEVVSPPPPAAAAAAVVGSLSPPTKDEAKVAVTITTTTATDGTASRGSSSSLRVRKVDPACQIICSSLCQSLTCCAKTGA